MVNPLLNYGGPWDRARQSVIDDIRGMAASINQRWAVTFGSGNINIVAAGGTGVGSLTAHGVLVGQGLSPLVAVGPGAANTLLHGHGAAADPSFSPVVEADLALTDVTTANVSSAAHGFAPKSPAAASKFLNGAATPVFAFVDTTDLTGASALTAVSDTNVTLTAGGSAVTALLRAASLTVGWTGTLAAARLNANVVQAVSNDTNITGSIAAQTLTFAWAGTLSVTRGGIGAGTLTSNGVLYGNGTSAVQALAANATATRKFLLQVSSVAPAWDTLLAADIPGSALTKTDDTNVTLTLGGTPATSLLAAASLTLGWTGTLAAARLNAAVVQAITNDTNVTGSIVTQTLTLGWTGTLAAARLNANVVQSIVNDTNVTGSISAQALTLGWTGTLGVARGGSGTSTAFTAGSVVFAGASGVYSQNNSSLFWDNSSGFLGIGTSASPAAALDVLTANVRVRMGGSSGIAMRIGGTYTGGSYGIAMDELTLVPSVNNNAIGIEAIVGISRAASGTHPVFTGLQARVQVGTGTTTVTDAMSAYIRIPNGTLSNVTRSTALYVEGAASGSTTNRALWVDGSGDSEIDGRLGIGQMPTAVLHVKAGTATASTAPLKLTAGTNLTTAEAGAMEYDGTNLFFTRAGTVRENVLVAIDNASAPTTAAGTPTTRYGGNTNYLGDPNRWMSVNILGTTYKVPLYT